MGTIDKLIRRKLPFSLLSLVYLVKNLFFNMFEKYFEVELQTHINFKERKVREKSREDLMKFLREFEVLPGLTSINTVCEFYNAVLNLDFEETELQAVKNLRKILGGEHGRVFSFHRFVFFMVKISGFVFSDPENVPRKFRML